MQDTICCFSQLLHKKEVKHFGLDLSVHIRIHEEKAFLLSCTSSIALHFIWQPTGSVLSPHETQDSQMAGWSHTILYRYGSH